MTKIDRVFNALMEGKSFNLFEAERQLHDHVLRTSISTLQQQHRITISRKVEMVRGYMGNPTHVCRYWIDPDEIQRIQNRRQIAHKEKAQPSDQTREGFSK